MRVLFLILFSISFLSPPSHGVVISPFSNLEQKQKTFSLIDDNYEDTRIDFDGDKKTDYWKIQQGSLILEIYFKNEKTWYHIRSFKKLTVDERLLLSQNNKLYLVNNTSRKQHVYNFTSSSNLCPQEVNSEFEKLKASLSEISTNQLDELSLRFIGNQCLDTLDAKIVDSVKSSIKALLSPPALSPNSYLQCLEGKSVRTIFEKRLGEKDGALYHEKAVAGYKKSIVNFTRLQDADQPILICKKDDSEKIEHPMRTLESGLKIQFSFGKSTNLADIREQLFHEALHLSAISQEDLVEDISDLCVKKRGLAKAQIEIESAGFRAVQTTEMNIAQAEKEAANNKKQVIPAKVAEAPLPPPKEQSPIEMNRLADAAGVKTTTEVSRNQTSGLVRMAENVLSSTPAVAATPTQTLASAAASTSVSASASDVVSSSRSKTSSTRKPASTYQLDMTTVKGKAPSVKIGGTHLKGDSVGKDEVIVEEVDLSKRPTVSTSKSTAAKKQTNNVPTSGSAASSVTNAEVTSGAAASFSGDSSSAIASSNQSSSSNSRILKTPTSSGKVSNDRSNTRTNRSPANDVVSIFSSGAYQQVRQKLKDSNFIQTLKESRVTVYDLSGNSYGATKGDVVFVDQGDRFVRQK